MRRAVGLTVGLLLIFACGGSPSAGVTTSPGSQTPGAAPSPEGPSPFPRSVSLAYDSTRGMVVLFGGLLAGGVSNETWTWDGRRWTQQTPDVKPSTRSGAALADDPQHHVVLLFGGDDGGSLGNDTWEWDGSQWKQVQTAHSPPHRFGAALTWDPIHHVAVLFGGYSYSVGWFADTWTFDGTDWTQKTPPASPTERAFAQIAFDAARGNVVLHGGFEKNDTWTWDGANWTKKNPANTPPVLTQASPMVKQMAYDPAHKDVVLLDPDATAGTMSTWAWNGVTWAPLASASAPPYREGSGLAYDARHSMSVFAGGMPRAGGDAISTWGWNGSNWSPLG